MGCSGVARAALFRFCCLFVQFVRVLCEAQRLAGVGRSTRGSHRASTVLFALPFAVACAGSGESWSGAWARWLVELMGIEPMTS
jgi:hypothetical protein